MVSGRREAVMVGQCRRSRIEADPLCQKPQPTGIIPSDGSWCAFARRVASIAEVRIVSTHGRLSSLPFMHIPSVVGELPTSG